MTIEYTKEHRSKLEAFLATHDLPRGLGHEESACTIASINLALTGKLTDETPDCMSNVLGKAAIALQDAMPDEMRNSSRYKSLIPNMPGTGREREAERLAVLMDWMWTVVLPQVQPVADKHGFGAEWLRMCAEKTANATTTDAIISIAYAVDVALAAARAAAYTATLAAARAAYVATYADFWDKVDPIGVLERMTYLDKGEDK